MNSKKLVTLSTIAATFILSCTSKPVEYRNPAGTGDVDSSTSATESFESYKLPVMREGKKNTRVAYNFWSGEWPQPIIDISSEVKGTTKIQGLSNLRNPAEAEKISCTVKNGLYHPWSEKDPSIQTYYSLVDVEDFTVLQDTKLEFYDRKGNVKYLRVPKSATISNLIYYGENYCGAILKIGKNKRPIAASCDYFNDNKVFKKMQENDDFREQWLYFVCEEKDAAGKAIKVFVRDQELLKQPGVDKGCPADYGKVQGAKNCGDNQR